MWIIIYSIGWLVNFSPLTHYPAANVDYTPREAIEITFPAGSTRQEYTVVIIDDFIPENSEFFNADVNLARPEDASILVIRNPKRPLIEIQDVRNSEWLTALNCAPKYAIHWILCAHKSVQAHAYIDHLCNTSCLDL